MSVRRKKHLDDVRQDSLRSAGGIGKEVQTHRFSFVATPPKPVSAPSPMVHVFNPPSFEPPRTRTVRLPFQEVQERVAAQAAQDGDKEDEHVAGSSTDVLSSSHDFAISDTTEIPHAVPYPPPKPTSTTASTSGANKRVTIEVGNNDSAKPKITKAAVDAIMTGPPREELCKSPGWADNEIRKTARKKEKMRLDAQKRFQKEMKDANRRAEREKRKSLKESDLESMSSETSFKARWSQIMTPAKADNRLSKPMPQSKSVASDKTPPSVRKDRITSAPAGPAIQVWAQEMTNALGLDKQESLNQASAENEQVQPASTGKDNLKTSNARDPESKTRKRFSSRGTSQSPSRPPISFYQRPVPSSSLRSSLEMPAMSRHHSKDSDSAVESQGEQKERRSRRSSFISSATDLPRRILRSVSTTRVADLGKAEKAHDLNPNTQTEPEPTTAAPQGVGTKRLRKQTANIAFRNVEHGDSKLQESKAQHSRFSTSLSAIGLGRKEHPSSALPGSDTGEKPATQSNSAATTTRAIAPSGPRHSFMGPPKPSTTGEEMKRTGRQVDKVPREDLPVYSWDEYIEQVKGGRDLIAIGGMLHDVTDFVRKHPGGKEFISQGIGKDATRIFNGDMHNHSMGAHRLLVTMRAGRLSPGWQKRAEETKQANDNTRGGCFRPQHTVSLPIQSNAGLDLSFNDGINDHEMPTHLSRKSSGFVTPPTTPSPEAVPTSTLPVTDPDRQAPSEERHSRTFPLARDSSTALAARLNTKRDETVDSRQVLPSYLAAERASISTPGLRTSHIDFLPPSPRQSLPNAERHTPNFSIPKTSSETAGDDRGSTSRFMTPSAMSGLYVPSSVTQDSRPASVTTSDEGSLPPAGRPREFPLAGSSSSISVSQRSIQSSPRKVAKVFVTCCGCKRWHDVPSKLYEKMAKQQLAVVGEGGQLIQRIDSRPWEINRAAGVVEPLDGLKTQLPIVPWPAGDDTASGPNGTMAAVSTSSDYHHAKEPRDADDLKCPWCQHQMSKFCCAAWLCNVKLHQRFH